MVSAQNLTVKQIAASAFGPRFWEEMRGSWATALLCRGPSIPLIWISAKFGVTPMAITVAGMLIALSLPFWTFVTPLALAPYMVAFFGYLFQVVDCVDGTLARLTDRVSKRGGDIDFIVDMAQWGVLYLSIGLLADRSFDTGFYWTAVGLIAAWGRLLARVIRDRLDAEQKDDVKPLQPADYPSAFLAGISGLIPFFALSGSYLGVAVTFLAIYALLDVIEGALPLLKRA